MAKWVQWVDNKVVGNAVYETKGPGDNWRQVYDKDIDPTVSQTITIVEEDGVLYRKGVEVTLNYEKKRLKEYPHYRDQLDMMYKDQVNGTTTWKDAITAVKNKYPKE
tara:strand:+ start:3014 stop:3334 length:321 start_codon:yes stop_codon:yes gene_type:complete